MSSEGGLQKNTEKQVKVEANIHSYYNPRMVVTMLEKSKALYEMSGSYHKSTYPVYFLHQKIRSVTHFMPLVSFTL